MTLSSRSLIESLIRVQLGRDRGVEDGVAGRDGDRAGRCREGEGCGGSRGRGSVMFFSLSRASGVSRRAGRARVAINLVSPCGRGGARRRRGASSGRREWCLAAPRARGSIAFQPVIMNFFAGDEICRGEAARAPRLFLALSADLRAPLSLHRCILAAKNRTTMPPR